MGEVKCAYSSQRQAEMADIGLLIHGLGERADHQTFEQQPIGPRAASRSTNWRNSRGVGFLRERRIRPAGGQDLLQLGDALILGLTVNAVQPAGLCETQRHRRLHIGGDHAFLDQAVRIVARDRIETFDRALRADARLDFAAAKIQSTARVARVLERAVHRVKRLQRNAAPPAPHRVACVLRILQVAPGLIVGQACMRDDHRLVESRLAGFTGSARHACRRRRPGVRRAASASTDDSTDFPAASA